MKSKRIDVKEMNNKQKLDSILLELSACVDKDLREYEQHVKDILGLDGLEEKKSS